MRKRDGVICYVTHVCIFFLISKLLVVTGVFFTSCFSVAQVHFVRITIRMYSVKRKMHNFLQQGFAYTYTSYSFARFRKNLRARAFFSARVRKKQFCKSILNLFHTYNSFANIPYVNIRVISDPRHHILLFCHRIKLREKRK